MTVFINLFMLPVDTALVMSPARNFLYCSTVNFLYSNVKQLHPIVPPPTKKEVYTTQSSKNYLNATASNVVENLEKDN